MVDFHLCRSSNENLRGVKKKKEAKNVNSATPHPHTPAHLCRHTNVLIKASVEERAQRVGNINEHPQPELQA